MATKDPRIDSYIAKAAPFAQPILNHIRKLVHSTCPEVEETIKWGFPHFDYKGEMMCSMASFKAHAVFGFWKASLMNDPALMDNAKNESSMGHSGKLTSLKDLPTDKKMIGYIKEAMKLTDNGIKLPPKKKVVKKDLVIPDFFEIALKKNKKANAIFQDFAYSHKKEYLEWITEAKTEVTREKRIAQALEMMSEGKSRNWKYQKK